MEASNRTVSPLRQRMLEDMRMHKLATKTQAAYIRAVCKFAKYLGRSPICNGKLTLAKLDNPESAHRPMPYRKFEGIGLENSRCGI